ncbi:LuxR C-terminal-related transcriptional regulator [Pseudonocardia spinosispora]|uniref:LuxR C-terminal-related transcriptional regulator n=1 Tax=Pseudonocardia spinosispora TaxID=103441 RepID=UPI000400D402|nr:response regulator transcription factor [Pseudonocardia spinosispora]
MKHYLGTTLAAPKVELSDYPVVIVDDHQLFSTSLRLALGGRGFAASELPVAELPELLGRPCPTTSGLVVLDLDLGRDERGGRIGGADQVARLREQGWLVLIVSGSTDELELAKAIAAGATGWLPKSGSFEALLDAVATAAQGSPLMTETERSRWAATHRDHQEQVREVSRRLARLSRREQEVLKLLSEGQRASAIAARFVVSMPTIRTQIRSLLAKLEVTSQLEAVALVRGSSL